MLQLETLLAGGDLRSIGKADSAVSKIKNQDDFDELFKCLFHQNRIIVMRAADSIEKITRNKPSYLNKYKNKIFEFCDTAKNKELRWHLALLIPRLHLNNEELLHAWNTLTHWANDKKESRIVRVNALQGLFELSGKQPSLAKELTLILLELEKENIPSIKARIKIIRKIIAS